MKRMPCEPYATLYFATRALTAALLAEYGAETPTEKSLIRSAKQRLANISLLLLYFQWGAAEMSKCQRTDVRHSCRDGNDLLNLALLDQRQKGCNSIGHANDVDSEGLQKCCFQVLLLLLAVPNIIGMERRLLSESELTNKPNQPNQNLLPLLQHC